MCVYLRDDELGGKERGGKELQPKASIVSGSSQFRCGSVAWPMLPKPHAPFRRWTMLSECQGRVALTTGLGVPFCRCCLQHPRKAREAHSTQQSAAQHPSKPTAQKPTSQESRHRCVYASSRFFVPVWRQGSADGKHTDARIVDIWRLEPALLPSFSRSTIILPHPFFPLSPLHILQL